MVPRYFIRRMERITFSHGVYPAGFNSLSPRVFVCKIANLIYCAGIYIYFLIIFGGITKQNF